MFLKTKELFDNDIKVNHLAQKNGIIANVESYTVYSYIQKTLESSENGYIVKSDILNSIDYGAPQNRRRFIAIGSRKQNLKNFEMPKPTISSDHYSTIFDAISDLELVKPFINIEDDIGFSVNSKYYQSKSMLNFLRDSNMIFNHIIPNTRDNAKLRFSALKEGENFHDLETQLKTNTYANINKTQNTIYARLSYQSQSGTVVNVRKSMWVHPVQNRAISVREAARLQTFPDSFVFFGKKDSQYQQVGNAVPPIFAKEIARKVRDLLSQI